MRLLFLLIALTAAHPLAAKPPNILFIFADDQRADSLGVNGNRFVRTPTIDRLAQRGVNFTNAYLTGGDSAALCSPSRAMLMTGRSFPRIERKSGWDMKPVAMLPNRLRDAGYQTFMSGKWHNGLPALRHAFPDAANVLNGGMGNHLTKKVVQISNGQAGAPATLPKYSTDAFTDAAVSFLESRQTEAPFFLYVAFSAPHDPRQPVSPWKEHHEANLPPLPWNFLPLPAFNTGALLIRDEHLAPWPRPERMIREQTAHYHAMIDHIDHSVKRLLDTLEKRGELENTVIVYAADNGLALGSHGLLGKQSGYEHSLKVPLIVQGPGVKSGITYAHPVALFDLMPTLLEVAGAKVPVGLDARSLAPALAGRPAPIRERISGSVYFGNLDIHLLREGDWKLIRYPRLDKTQLFNVAADPHEMKDLAPEAGQASRVSAMLATLEIELKANGVDRPLVTDKRIPATVDPARMKQQMDAQQPAWIRERFSYPEKPVEN